MVGLNTGLAHKKSASPYEIIFFAISPDVKNLINVFALKTHVHTFNNSSALGS